MQNNKQELNDLCLEIWNEYVPNLRKFCNERLSGTPQEIDDVIADTFMALCEAVNEGREIDNYRTWLYGTLKNLIKMKYSELKKARETTRSLTGLSIELSYTVDYLDEILNDNEIERIRVEIYDELSAKDKELLVLVYENDFTSKQVAKLWGSTVAAVKQRRYRLKKTIARLAKEKIKNI